MGVAVNLFAGFQKQQQQSNSQQSELLKAIAQKVGVPTGPAQTGTVSGGGDKK